ncbi:MAG: ABC transporter substrate-binding protein [Clostridia bacterium]
MNGKSNLIVAIAVILVFALALVACGAPDLDTSEPREEDEAGQDEKILVRYAPYGDPENLDPIVRGRMGAMAITMNLFDGLVRHDAETARVEPAIAEDWEISEDGLVYTFHLREDAVFHNGREITAEDFIYSFERLSDPENASPLAHYLDGVVGKTEFEDGDAETIEGLRAVDDFTLEITREEPDSSFLSTLAFPAASVVPREVVEEKGSDFGHEPVGSGPFTFDSWVKDDRVKVSAFEDYYRGRAELDGVEFRVISEAATKEAEFLSGNLDAFIAPASIYRKYRDDEDYSENIIEVAEFFTRHIGFHCEKEPFDDVRVRRAFNHAIDKKEIIDVVLGGKGVPAVGYLPSSSFAFDPDLEGYEYDPDLARDLLAEAGYEDGFEVSIMTSENPEWGLPIVEAVMPYLNEVGIRLKPETMDTGVLYDRLRAGEYESYIYSTGGDAHPVSYLWRFHSDLASDTNRYWSEDLDAVLKEARSTSDEDEMVALVREADAKILRDAPVWFFHYNKAVTMHSDRVAGLKPVPIDMALQDLWSVTVEP